jgi:hypothetical protein
VLDAREEKLVQSVMTQQAGEETFCTWLLGRPLLESILQNTTKEMQKSLDELVEATVFEVEQRSRQLQVRCSRRNKSDGFVPGSLCACLNRVIAAGAAGAAAADAKARVDAVRTQEGQRLQPRVQYDLERLPHLSRRNPVAQEGQGAQGQTGRCILARHRRDNVRQTAGHAPRGQEVFRPTCSQALCGAAKGRPGKVCVG